MSNELVTANETSVRLSLLTQRPDAGCILLDGLAEHLLASKTVEAAEAFPATVSQQRGGSITPYRLFWLSLLSSFVGVLGLILHDRAKSKAVLRSPEDVQQASGLPAVISMLDQDRLTTSEQNHRQQERIFSAALRASELSIAVVFLLMVLNLATQNALVDRFVADPLAAYGEVLTRVLG